MTLTEQDWMEIVKFPLSIKAKEMYKKSNMTIDNISRNHSIIRLAFDNLSLILNDIDQFIEKKVTDPINEALAYPLQNVMIAKINDTWFLNKYAEAYTKKFRKTIMTREDIVQYFIDKNITIEKMETRKYKMNFLDYVQLNTKVKPMNLLVSKEYNDVITDQRLINRVVSNGFVENLTINDLMIFFHASIYSEMNEKIKNIVKQLKKQEIPSIIQAFIIKIIKRIDSFKRNLGISTYYEGTVYNDAFPSCINCLQDKLISGKNLSHSERLTLLFFYMNVGMRDLDIINLFKHYPDFKIDKTFEVIKQAREKKYQSYACKKIKSLGLCQIIKYNDPYDWCKKGNIFTPIVYNKKMSNWLETKVLPVLCCFPFIIMRNGKQKHPKNLGKDKIRFTRKHLYNFIMNSSKRKQQDK